MMWLALHNLLFTIVYLIMDVCVSSDEVMCIGGNLIYQVGNICDGGYNQSWYWNWVLVLPWYVYTCSNDERGSHGHS